MSETKKYLLGDGVDCKQTHTVTRSVGSKEYDIVYHETNGDEYERILYASKAKAGGDETKREKIVSEMLREAMLVEVAGSKYSTAQDRKMPIWLLADVNEFIIGYISGNL